MSSNQEITLKTFSRDFLLGGISAAIAKTVYCPSENAKWVFHIEKYHEHIPNLYPKVHYIFRRYLVLAKVDGISALWRNNMTNLIRYVPIQALNFSFYHLYKSIFCQSNPNMDFLKLFIAGGAAAVSSLVFVYPINMVRIKLAADKGKQYTGYIDCMTKITKTSGVKELYKHFNLFAFGTAIFRACYFSGYDTLKKALFSDEKHANIIYRYIISRFVTTFAGIVSFPVDTVYKNVTRQTQLGKDGSIECCRKIYRQEGIKGFFKGAIISSFRKRNGPLVLVLYDELFGLVMNREKQTRASL